MFPYQEKLSNINDFDTSTQQSWTSPIETLQEKERKNITCRLRGDEIMAYESLPKSWLKSQ